MQVVLLHRPWNITFLCWWVQKITNPCWTQYYLATGVVGEDRWHLCQVVNRVTRPFTCYRWNGIWPCDLSTFTRPDSTVNIGHNFRNRLYDEGLKCCKGVLLEWHLPFHMVLIILSSDVETCQTLKVLPSLDKIQPSDWLFSWLIAAGHSVVVFWLTLIFC